MNKRILNAVDVSWLLVDTDDTPMHVGVLATFRKPRNAAPEYISDLAAQLAADKNFAPPWNCKLARKGRLPLFQRLIEDSAVELDYHFRHTALPTPGGEKELGRMVSRLHSNALDFERPLWEFYLIEGLERNRFAFYLKIHHAMIGDVNAIPLLMAHLSSSSQQKTVSPIWSKPIPASENAQHHFDLKALLSAGKAGAGLIPGALTNSGLGKYALSTGTPRSSLNCHINHQRRFATQQIESSRIEALAEATDSSVDELLVYFYGTVLRRFFKEYNALPEESLVGFMPLALRELTDNVPSNAVAGMRVALGTHIADPLTRLNAVKQSIQTIKVDRDTLPHEVVLPYALLRSTLMFASQAPVLGRFIPPAFNLGISHTSAADRARYFCGSKLEAIYPLSQLMQYSALSIDSVSYAGTLNFGFTGGRDTLPSLQRIAVYFGKAVADLEQLVNVQEGVA